MIKKQRRPEGIYTPFKQACSRKGTNISNVLKKCNRSDGNTGTWKVGGFPRLDIAMDIADYLEISLDELCYGIENARSVAIDENQAEWLAIISRIPPDRQQLCKEFLKTHAVIPDKYEDSEKKTS